VNLYDKRGHYYDAKTAGKAGLERLDKVGDKARTVECMYHLGKVWANEGNVGEIFSAVFTHRRAVKRFDADQLIPNSLFIHQKKSSKTLIFKPCQDVNGVKNK
jgi:hypothetical protein